MYKVNFDRMIKLAEEFFDMKNDPLQISITKATMKRLQKIHLSTLTEKKNKDGPIAWIAIIPTTKDLMELFISKKINEQELLNLTPLKIKYDTIYLCSALVLPEFRGKGLAKRLTVKAIKSIKAKHPIECLFYWAFSGEGKKSAASVAKQIGLPLYSRKV